MESDIIQEQWRDVVGFEGFYEVSNIGRIKSLPNKVNLKERILKKYIDNSGYEYVSLYKQNFNKKFKVHRLVALAFHENANASLQVNHINGIKTDNRAENLEWLTAGDNQRHAFRIGLRKGKNGKHNPSFSGAVNQYDLNGNFIRQWECMRQIKKELNFDDSAISRHIYGNKNYSHAYGFKWKFA